MKAPNFLILMADQLAPQYTGAYGHQAAKTPNLDRLAERGCRFDACYTPYPQCAPARFSILSGQYASRIRAYDNAAEFSSAIPTICHHLAQFDYHSSLSGKMHFIGPDQLHGFSERLTTDIYPADYAFTPNWMDADERIDEWYHNMTSVHEAGPAQMTYQLEFDNDAGYQGIRKLYDYARNPNSGPFMMVVSFTHPHDPYVAQQKWWDLYDGVEIEPPKLTQQTVPLDPHSLRLLAGNHTVDSPPSEESIIDSRRAYFANTSYVDDWVGQFVDTLKATDLLDDTIVIFTADHGDMLGERGLWYKMNFFEHSARVPLIVAGRDVQPAEIPNVCSTLDLFPTLIELASDGRNESAGHDVSVDGRSLHELLTGGLDTTNFAISEYSAECTSHPMVMIRRDNLKYIHCESDPPMLFDLANDPDEVDNLASKETHQEVLKSFQDEVATRWDLEKLRQDIIADQKSRLLIHSAMKRDRSLSWEFQPLHDATQAYIRTHQNLEEMAERARYPKFPI